MFNLLSELYLRKFRIKIIFYLLRKSFLEIKEEELYLLNAIEKNKCIKEIEKMYKFLAKFDAKRNITLISIGGGTGIVFVFSKVEVVVDANCLSFNKKYSFSLLLK